MRTMIQPPTTSSESVVDILHGVSIADPYRWLEDQNSSRTRQWIEEQTSYTRFYFDGIPGRAQIRARVRKLLDRQTYDSFLMAKVRYFFRKRLPNQEQPSIYFREGMDGKDELLVDPSDRGTGNFTAVKPLCASPDGNFLLYEVKQGGERNGTFEFLDVVNRKRLKDTIPHGYLRGFAFAPDGKSFCYVHEASGRKRPFYRAAFHHILGAPFEEDREVFYAGEEENIRLCLIPAKDRLGFLVYRFLDKTYKDFYVWRTGSEELPEPLLLRMESLFAPQFVDEQILAMTDFDAPNRRIVEVRRGEGHAPLFVDIVRACDSRIRSWLVARDHILVSYTQEAKTRIEIFALSGKLVGDIPNVDGETVRLTCANSESDDVLLERQSFFRPTDVHRYSPRSGHEHPWAPRKNPFDSHVYASLRVSFPSKDGVLVPMSLVGQPGRLAHGTHATVMTSYGGYGVPMTPQFSILVACLMERGCVFALPGIRGGSEFGGQWHNAAKGRNRQVAFDDFIAAAEWLITTGRTEPTRLGIFGGSNSGLLVAAAMTQRPQLFRAVLCLVPLLDMLRYHLFDDAHAWKEEFGTAEDLQDFQALASYSPYHAVREGMAYPAAMIVSGDADQSCNALHARKMTARLQAANSSNNPILIDYSTFRGHSPVLPLTTRVDALTDRIAFLCDQLGLAV
jgi:prolyl oligopeptidase